LNFKILFKKSVDRDLKKIDNELANRILNKIEEDLSEKADSLPSLTRKFSGLKKCRIGLYRVIFTIIGESIIILRISHRREAL